MRKYALVLSLAALLSAPAASASLAPHALIATRSRVITYRSHDGQIRRAWLLYPARLIHRPIPLIISPHGRGLSGRANARIWGDLPGMGDFAVINPAGQGRVLHQYSWGYPGEISDLARMVSIAQHHGIPVNRRRVYAVGGSMGGQETLLLAARYPHLLAGAIAFDPATNLRRRYVDFAALPNGKQLQQFMRREVGGTPTTNPGGYAVRSPSSYAKQLAFSGVKLQLWWSTRDRIIRDQRLETGALAKELRRLNPHMWLRSLKGTWAHTAEMEPWGRLPDALAWFHLLPKEYATWPHQEPIALST